MKPGLNAPWNSLDQIRVGRFTKAIGIGWVLFLSLLPASTPQGAIPFLPVCSSDPPPLTGWGVLWFPDEPALAIAAGRELLVRPDYPAAVCYFNLIEETQSNDPLFQAELGEAYWGAGDPEQALAHWEKALVLNPEMDEVLDRLWRGYLETKQWDNAEGAIERWLSRHADDLGTRYRLALIYAARNPGSALELLTELQSASEPFAPKARALSAAIRAAIAVRVPEYIYARTGEELLRIGEPELAQEALRLAIERNPNYGEAFALLGLAQEASGEDPGESFRKGVALAPESALTCMVYGSWLRRTGENVLARWWLLQAWSAQPGDWLIAAELSNVDFLLGNLADAETWIQEAVDSHPEESEAWVAMAGFYIENDYRVEEKGIPAARQAVVLEPTSDPALDMLGWGWYKMGDFSMAERLFLRALDQNPDSASAHLHLGLCYWEQGRAAEARTEWEAALRLDPSGSAGLKAGDLLERK